MLKWKQLKLNTLRKRMALMLSVGVFLCILLLIVVSYGAMRAMQQNKVEPAIAATFQQVSEQMTQEYYSLIQITQQMMPQGGIGAAVNQYLEADEQYDRIQLSRQISESLSALTYSNQHNLLVTYLTPFSGKPFLFANLPLREDFDLSEFPLLVNNQELSFYGLHLSQNRVSNDNVIAVVCPVLFNDGELRTIYVEATSTILDSLEAVAEAQNVPRYFIQTDNKGVIRYSNIKEFPIGETMDFSNKMPDNAQTGRIGDYVWLKQAMPFDCSNVLLIPANSYDRELRLWTGGVILVVGITFAVLAVTSILLMRLIYHPLQLLRHEIERLGKGELDLKEHITEIEEFNELFQSFNRMKEQVAQLMGDVRDSEQAQKKLELDKLYYQINPHFLMNSLNSVHWMAAMNGQTEINTFVSQLNYILGYSLEKTDRKATLRTELKVLELYVELQKQRYDFQTWMDVEQGDYLEYPTARLILQPLAENAICHNINDFGNIWVVVRKLEHMISIVIRDDGKGFVLPSQEIGLEKPGRANSGIGLRYVRLSLQSYYGERAQMTLQSEPGGGTTVTLLIPLENGNGEDSDV